MARRNELHTQSHLASIPMLLIQMLLWIALLDWRHSLADQTVFIERYANQGTPYAISEPVFNPDTLDAVVGEQIHFVARFESVRPYRPGVLHKS